LASAALVPLNMFATVLLPAPAPPTTATCKGSGGCWSKKGPIEFRTSASAKRSSPACDV
jgi:hypothetical protein